MERENNDGVEEGAVPLALFFGFGVAGDFNVEDLTIEGCALGSREVCLLQDILHGSGHRVVEISVEVFSRFELFSIRVAGFVVSIQRLLEATLKLGKLLILRLS